MVARLELAAELALEPADCALEEWAAAALAHVDSLPHRDRRDAACEVLRQLELVAGEQRDRKAARLAQELVEGCLAGDRDPDERRLERERDERRERQAEACALDLDRGDGDPDGVAPQCRSQFVAARHGAESTALYTALQSGSPARNCFCVSCICRSNALSYAPSAPASQ